MKRHFASSNRSGSAAALTAMMSDDTNESSHKRKKPSENEPDFNKRRQTEFCRRKIGSHKLEVSVFVPHLHAHEVDNATLQKFFNDVQTIFDDARDKIRKASVDRAKQCEVHIPV